MNYPYGLLADIWHWLALAIYTGSLLYALRTCPWQRIQPNHVMHAYFGACVALLLLWSIRSDVIPGLDYHYLGATLLTLMFGWQLAFLALSIVLLGLVINGASDWQAYPLNALIMGLFPVWLSHSLYRLVDRRLPNHFFVYIFINAFFGAGLVLLVTLLLACGITLLGGLYNWSELKTDYLPFFPLMIFPEAFITGFLMTILVVMKPEWVYTFDDHRYLNGK
mgnify:CR=1 FL=1